MYREKMRAANIFWKTISSTFTRINKFGSMTRFIKSEIDVNYLGIIEEYL